jgi:hypothetical protein
MSVYIQEVLGLLSRGKKKLKLDSQKDHIEFGRLYSSGTLNTGTSYAPKMEPFVTKFGDLKCDILTDVVLQNGTATVKTLPMYAPVSGSCVTQNTSIEDSIASQSTVGGITSININGGLIVEGATILKTKIELGVAGDAVNGTSLFNRILDSAGAQAGAANRILRSLPDGRVVWSDDDPVVSLTYGSIWRGSAANVKEELAIGTAGQVLTANGTTASWANPAVSGTGSANNMTMWTSATTIGNSAPVPMIQSGTGASATLTIGDGNDQTIATDGILYVNGPLKDSGGNLGTAGQILRADSSSQLIWTSTMIAGLNFNDDVKLTFGDVGVPGDLEIFHNAANSVIKDTGTGSLMIQGSNLILQASLTKNAIICGDSDSVDIYYNGVLKLQTANTGIKITGGILDVNDQLGTAGQLLSSTGTTLDWVDGFDWRISDGTVTGTVIKNEAVQFLGGTKIATVLTVAGGNPEKLTINHDNTTRTDTTSAVSPGLGGTFTVIDSITQDATGHTTAANVKTVTLPPQIYKVYTALITQTGTASPVVIVLENTTSATIAWTRNATGRYIATASATLFTIGKTLVSLSSGSTSGTDGKFLKAEGTASTTIQAIYNHDTNTNASVDGISAGSMVEFRIYA